MAVFYFGQKSEHCLSTCHPAIALVAREALALGLIDFGVIHGFRDKDLQDLFFNSGQSKVKWPDSKHNVQHPKTGIPWSWAMDILIYINGTHSWRREYYVYAAGVIQACGIKLGVPIRWGGNWDMDAEPLTDQTFQDLGHFEITREPDEMIWS